MVTDDWRYRMLTPPKGNADYIPVNAEARKVMDAWDPAKDEAAAKPAAGTAPAESCGCRVVSTSRGKTTTR